MEGLATAVLLCAIVASGIMGVRLSGGNVPIASSPGKGHARPSGDYTLQDANSAAGRGPMTKKQKLLLATGAAALAAIGMTGAWAASHAGASPAGCPKTDCTKECPKECEPCPGSPDC